MTSVSVVYRTVTIEISHEPATSIGTPAEDVVVIVEENCEPDMLTRIHLWSDEGAIATVLLHWETVITLEKVVIHFDDDTQTLFVGAHTVAAAVQIRKRQIVDQHTVTLVWSFQLEGEYVLELGELDVFLRRRTGEIIASAPVDPPYDMTRTPEGLRFDSPVYGEKWLRFPK